jgi:hypothetical protein
MNLAFFTSKAFFRSTGIFFLGVWLVCGGFRAHLQNKRDDLFIEFRKADQQGVHEINTENYTPQLIDSINRISENVRRKQEVCISKINKLSKSIKACMMAQKISFLLWVIMLIIWMQMVQIERLKRKMKK